MVLSQGEMDRLAAGNPVELHRAIMRLVDAEDIEGLRALGKALDEHANELERFMRGDH